MLKLQCRFKLTHKILLPICVIDMKLSAFSNSIVSSYTFMCGEIPSTNNIYSV